MIMTNTLPKRPMSSSFPGRDPMSLSPHRPQMIVCSLLLFFLSLNHKQEGGLTGELDKAWHLDEIALEKYTPCLLVCVEWSLIKMVDTDAAMMAKVLPKNPDLETLDEVHNTWHLW